ncbi:hypothetical protein DHX103_03745 [Planococcus sp. X10-3]|uniref:hypothetical protein n=1 Tax=Planococcus sp. X10-3 TaxID=3061240 RepID=UPI003BB18605
MDEKKKAEDFLTKTKGQVEKMIQNVDKEKIKEIDSKLSMERLKYITKILLVGSVLSMGVFGYWNYNHNMGEPYKVDITNKDLRDVKNRTLKRWGY